MTYALLYILSKIYSCWCCCECLILFLCACGILPSISMMLDIIHVQNPFPRRIKTKSKVSTQRTYFPDGYRKRAACLCFRTQTKSEVLLVTSRVCQDFWVIPGGGLEPDEDPGVAAVRELREEAGVQGELIESVGTFDDITVNGTKHRTEVYVTIMKEEFDSWEDKLTLGRCRRWFPIADAFKQLNRYKPVQELYLRRAIMGT